jgi:hypothetical protein
MYQQRYMQQQLAQHPQVSSSQTNMVPRRVLLKDPDADSDPDPTYLGMETVT